MASCLPKDKTKEQRYLSLDKIADKFDKHPYVDKMSMGAGDFDTIYETVTGRSLNEPGLPTVQQLKKLNRLVDQSLTKMNRHPGKFTEQIWLPEEVMKFFPGSRRYFRDFQSANARFRGSSGQFKSQLFEIFGHLKDASMTNTLKERVLSKVPGAKKRAPESHKKLRRLYSQYRKLRADGQVMEAEALFKNDIEHYVREGEGAALKDFHELVTSEAAWEGRGKYNDSVVRAAKVWRNTIQPATFKLLDSGLTQYILGMKRLASEHKGDPKFDDMMNTLLNVQKRLKQRDNYFPVRVLDVVPTLAKASEKIFSGGDKGFNEGVQLIKNIETILDNNITVNKHLFEQSDTQKRLSYDVIDIIDSYMVSVNRFNFVARNFNIMTDATDYLWKANRKITKDPEGQELNIHLEWLANYLADTHDINVGTKFENQRGHNLVRTITAWEFVSKLATNVLSHGKNAGQSLQHYVYFGIQGINKTRGEMKDSRMKNRVNRGLTANGYLFANIQEVYGEKLSKYVLDTETGVYKEVYDVSYGDRIADSVARVAETMGKPMQWVENNINRQWAYELGFTQQWRRDARRTNYLEDRFKRRNKGWEEWVDQVSPDAEMGKNLYEYKFSEYLELRANNHANDVIGDLHYDYAMGAKSKILATRAGSVVGQFQHYGVNFFNYNRKMIKGGVEDLSAGMWAGEGAWRMYRLGLLYAMVSGYGISALVNAKLSSVIEHDLVEKAMRYQDALDDDPEVRKGAFYGGPVVGGPFISDLLTIGNITNLIEMDEDSTLAYLAGYEDFADATDDEKLKDTIRVLNTGIYKIIYKDLPLWASGASPATIAANQFNLKPDKTIRKTREEGWVSPLLAAAGAEPKKDTRPSQSPRAAQTEALAKAALDALG